MGQSWTAQPRVGKRAVADLIPVVPSPYGLHRVVGERGTFPQLARTLDVTMPCQSNEIEILVDQIHIDASSFRQLKQLHGSEREAISNAVIKLVGERGKLHNPITNSGGMLIGTVRNIGELHANPPHHGQRIASLASLTLTPLRLEGIQSIDMDHCRLSVRGTAFLFESACWAALPAHIPETTLLAAFDVAGAPARVHLRTRPGDRVLIVGAGNSGLLSALAAVDAGASEVILADVDPRRFTVLQSLNTPTIIPLCADVLDGIEFARQVGARADLTVSCVDVPGAEPACILSTQENGRVLFFSMATEFTRAALCAEGIGSAVTLEIGNGFMQGHAKYVIDILRRFPPLTGILGEAKARSS
jgi:L-erythro-3,5-diaminohexanoate dehydrogenase